LHSNSLRLTGQNLLLKCNSLIPPAPRGKFMNLTDLTPANLRAAPDADIRLAWLRVNQWYGAARQAKAPIEDVVNAAAWVLAEFARRGLAAEQTELARVAQTVVMAAAPADEGGEDAAKPGEKPRLLDVGAVNKSIAVRLVKRDAERRLVTGVVLEPDTVDLQKDTVTAEEIGLAMERWMLAGHAWDVQHEGPEREDIKLVECYQCPADVVIGEEPVRKGTWVTTVKVLDDDLWAKVKAGEITGFSIEGLGVRTPVNA